MATNRPPDTLAGTPPTVSERRWGSTTVPVIVTKADPVSGSAGASMVTTGASVSTVTATPADEPAFPAASVARATSVESPSGSVTDAVNAPFATAAATPFTVTPLRCGSAAVPATVTREAASCAFGAGAVIATAGACVSRPTLKGAESAAWPSASVAWATRTLSPSTRGTAAATKRPADTIAGTPFTVTPARCGSVAVPGTASVVSLVSAGRPAVSSATAGGSVSSVTTTAGDRNVRADASTASATRRLSPSTSGTLEAEKLAPESVAATPPTRTPARFGTSATPVTVAVALPVSVPGAGDVIRTSGAPTSSETEIPADRPERPARSRAVATSVEEPGGIGTVAVKRFPETDAATPLTVMSTRFASTNVPVTEIGDAPKTVPGAGLSIATEGAAESTTNADTAVVLAQAFDATTVTVARPSGPKSTPLASNVPPETDAGTPFTVTVDADPHVPATGPVREATIEPFAGVWIATVGAPVQRERRRLAVRPAAFEASARTSSVALASTVTSKVPSSATGVRTPLTSRNVIAVSGSRALPRTRTAVSDTAASSTGSTSSTTGGVSSTARVATDASRTRTESAKSDPISRLPPATVAEALGA